MAKGLKKHGRHILQSDRALYNQSLEYIAMGDMESVRDCMVEIKHPLSKDILLKQMEVVQLVKDAMARGKYRRAHRFIEDGSKRGMLIGSVRKAWRRVLEEQLMQYIPERHAQGKSIEKYLVLLKEKKREELQFSLGNSQPDTSDIAVEVVGCSYEDHPVQQSQEGGDVMLPAVDKNSDIDIFVEAGSIDVQVELDTINSARMSIAFGHAELSKTEKHFFRKLLEHANMGDGSVVSVDELELVLQVKRKSIIRLIGEAQSLLLKNTQWRLHGDRKKGVCLVRVNRDTH